MAAEVVEASAEADPGPVTERTPQKFVGKLVQLSRRVVIPNHLAPVPPLYVTKNRGKRVGSCGTKGLQPERIFDAGVKLGFNGFYRICSFHVVWRHSIPRRARRKQKAADLHQAPFELEAEAEAVKACCNAEIVPQRHRRFCKNVC